MTMFSVSNVSKSFGDVQVLKDINLQAPEGSFITILGPSGCGKTTMLRIIAGLETPDQGLVANGETTYVDTDKNHLLAARDRQLGFVFQDFALWPHMTVIDNVAFPLKMQKVPDAEIAERCQKILEDVRLWEHAQKFPEQLSGGQKQRVSIARALVARPRLVLFDEPLSALDANLRVELGQEIRLLSKKHGVTCVNVTHDRREAQVLSDKIALMKSGVIHQFADPETVFRAPVDVWAATFLDSGNILPSSVLPDIASSGESHILIPRGSLYLEEDATHITSLGSIEVEVLDCIYFEERYEILGQLQGHRVRFYGTKRVEPSQSYRLTVDLNDVKAIHDDAA